MKFTALSILFSICLYCFADDTNIILKTDWSEPVGLQNLETGHDHAIRGRLLIVAGVGPAHGGPKDNAAMTFIELQNVTGAMGEDVDVCFEPKKLNCALTDEQGKEKEVPERMWGLENGIHRVTPYWITLPYNSTIRLFVKDGQKSPLSVFPNGDWSTHWSVSNTNDYYLSGTLEISTRTNGMEKIFGAAAQSFKQSYYDRNCVKTLTFPKVKISVPK